SVPGVHRHVPAIHRPPGRGRLNRVPGRVCPRPETTTARIPERDTGRRQVRSDRADALRLRALGTLGDLELDALRLLEAAVTLGLDGGVVDEDVVTDTVLGDEAVALLRVEPLVGSLCHVVNVLPGNPLERLLCSLHWCRNASPHVSASGRDH